MTHSDGCSTAGPRWRGRAWRWGVVGALLVASFLAGTWVGARPWWVALWGARPPVLALPGQEEQEEQRPQEVLEALRKEVAQLGRRETELRREVREADVALKLLKASGQERGARAWREQEELRRRAMEELALTRREKAEAERLVSALRQALREERPEMTGLDRETERRARSWLLRRGE